MSNAPEEPSPEPNAPQTDDWQSSLGDFLAARLDLIRLEARDAGRVATKKAILVGSLATCAFFCWMLITAGLIGLISAIKPEWTWYGVTLIFGVLYLLVAGAAFILLRKPSPEAFSVTRSELDKDREWLNRLTKNPKSPN